jgi:hypothetical protein
MKKFFTLFTFLSTFFGALAQCPSGQQNITVDVTTDQYGYECFWQITNSGAGCGNGVVGTFGNTNVGCAGANGQSATGADPGAYASNSVVTETIGCLTTGSCFDIIYVDDYMDGGATFQVYSDGIAQGAPFVGNGEPTVWSFCVTPPPPPNPCTASSEVYLTNIAFVDAQMLTNYNQPYFDNVYNGANIFDDQGNAINVLPTSINENPNNPANLIDIGVPIRFKFQTQNRKQNGQSIVSGSCKLRTNDVRITITDSTAGLNNVAWNNNAWSTNEFEFMVQDTVTQSFTAIFEVVVIEDGVEYSTPCIPIPIKAISLNSRTVDDDDNPDSMGDGDGLVEPNERIETYVKINNNSEFNANYVEGNLLSFDGTSFYNNIGDIHIWNSDLGISGPVSATSWYNYFQNNPNTIAAGATAVTSQFDFVFDYNYPQTYSFSLPFLVATGYYIFGTANPSVFMLSSFDIEYNAGQPAIPPSIGVSEIASLNNQIRVYPNPAADQLFIETSKFKESNLDFVIYDMSGRVVKNETIKYLNSPLSIDLSDLKAGIYNVQIIAGNTTYKERIIKL